MKQWKRVLGIVLAWCALSSVCAMGAESTVEKRDQEEVVRRILSIMTFLDESRSIGK